MVLAVCAWMSCAPAPETETETGDPTDERTSDQRFSYSFEASRRHSEPSACGTYLLVMQLVFEEDLHKVTAVISSQTWSCDLREDASTYDITCDSPRADPPTVEATLSIVLFEPASKANIAGEATLIIRTDSGSCEHSYALDGHLDDECCS